MVRTDEVAAQVLDGGEELFVVSGGEPVVPVEKREVLATRFVDPGVACGGQSSVLLVSDIHRTRELALRAREDVRCLVARAVVDENEFEVLPRVRTQALQGVGRILLHVVERHDDGELDHPCDVRGGPAFVFTVGEMPGERRVAEP